MSTPPRTLNELFFGAMDRSASRPVAMRVKRGGTWVGTSFADLLSQVQAFSIGLHELGVNAGDRLAILSENRPEWAIDRLRLPGLPLRRRAGVPHAARPPDRVHPARLGRRGGLLLVRRPAREDPRDPRQPAGAQDDRRLRRGRRHRRRRSPSSRSSPRAAPRIAEVPDLAGRRPRGQAGRPRHPHLHLGHHRRPEGRDAHPRQHHLRRGGRAPGPRPAAERRVPLLPAALPHLRADGGPLLHDAAGRHHQLRHQHRERPDRDGRAPADGGLLGAAPLREDLRPRARERDGGLADQAEDLPLGQADRRGVGRAGHRGQADPGGARLQVPHRAQAGLLEAGGAGRRPAAVLRLRRRARSRPTSPGSSTPPACRSWRATA